MDIITMKTMITITTVGTGLIITENTKPHNFG
jgi:hypothetical protein